MECKECRSELTFEEYSGRTLVVPCASCLEAHEDAGYKRGNESGYDSGYNEGEQVGYDRGREAGYEAGLYAGQDNC